jgi:hypothetical protein
LLHLVLHLHIICCFHIKLGWHTAIVHSGNFAKPW